MPPAQTHRKLVRQASLVAALLVASGCGGRASADKSGPTANGPGSTTGVGGAGDVTGTGGAGVSTGDGGSVDLIAPQDTGSVKLRLLTQAEYNASISSLFGMVKAPLALPDDTTLAGYVSVGAGEATVSDRSATQYEAASLAATAEVFADASRWQAIVGCQPKADLSDACVTTFIKNFGRNAFRRELEAEEVTQWVGVAQAAAALAGTATQGLSTAISGMLQSPNFLYRVESNELDPSNARLKYDGLTMATRLSFLLTGGPPSSDLITAALAGKLDTADGIRAAAAPMLKDDGSIDRMLEFFSEWAAVQQVLKVPKSATLFPSYNAALQQSMFQGTRLFVKNIVLAPGADVRSFYDSNVTYADALLAPMYGVPAPATGFAQVPAAVGRAGILGEASVIAGHSGSEYNSPPRRGLFILQNLLCHTPPSPPPGVITTLPPATTPMTTRQELEASVKEPSCAACHALLDPLGFALEHFDAIGQYRTVDNGLPIDATGALDGVAVDGVPQLGAALRQSTRALTCMLANFYRDANGRVEDNDAAQIDSLTQDLAMRHYVWRDLVTDFVVSDAFRSAPALPSQ